MKISIVYVYPMNCSVNYDHYVYRFLERYQQFKPQGDHESIVVLNNGKQSSELTCMFSVLPNLRFIEHDNSGHDIGAFQKAAKTCTSEIIAFFGVSTYFRHNIWLQRIEDSVKTHGPGLYGAMGNRGNIHAGGGVYPHLRTTGFWASPELFNSYPIQVVAPHQRYPFEHGSSGITSWMRDRRIQIFEVTVSRVLTLAQWGMDPNGYHQGDQSALLFGDRMTEPPFYPYP